MRCIEPLCRVSRLAPAMVGEINPKRLRKIPSAADRDARSFTRSSVPSSEPVHIFGRSTMGSDVSYLSSQWAAVFLSLPPRCILNSPSALRRKMSRQNICLHATRVKMRDPREKCEREKCVRMRSRMSRCRRATTTQRMHGKPPLHETQSELHSQRAIRKRNGSKPDGASSRSRASIQALRRVASRQPSERALRRLV